MINLTINGKPHALDVAADMPLLWVLRDVVGLTGTKYSCGVAVCGACTVHMDGAPIRACITPLGAAQGKAITTIEGVHSPIATAIQNAWIKLDVVQCGFCQSGQIMSAIDLLSRHKQPDDAQINAAMDSNLCRCNTYLRIRAAIKEAAKALV